MSKLRFRLDTGFLSANFTGSQRTFIITLFEIAGLLVAYLDYRYPATFIAPIATLFVVGIQAVGGFSAGIIAAGSIAVIFAVAEEASMMGRIDARMIGDFVPLFLTYLLVALLLEFVRHQNAALHENRMRLQSYELRQTRSELAESDARYRAVGESMPFGIWHCGADGHVTYMSDSFLRLIGMTLEETANGGWLKRVLPDDAARIQKAWQNRSEWGELWEDEYRIIGVDNHMYTILCRGRSLCDQKGDIVGWTGINLDITERARIREQLSFLSEAGRILSLSLDPSTTLERIASLTVPRLADWCGVDLIQEDGQVASIIVLHADPSKTEIARELRAYPQEADETRGLLHVLRTGKAELYEYIPDELLAQAARDERHLWLLRELGMQSVLIVPLIARDKILGAITLVTAESGRRYSQDDLAFVEILSRRAALAYDNARMYAREQRVADTLQRASLPTSLPQLPGIRLRATYLPGATESEIGGDWYDAFQLPDGKLAISMGDVAGKGLRAAVAMASARQALRATALEGSPPHEVLERANRLLVHEGTGMVTAVFGVLDPVTLSFVFANAGHPPPLLARPGGAVQKLVAKGLPLGLFGDNQYTDETAHLNAGCLLVLYTDGLIEFDRNVVSGETIVTEAVQAEGNSETPDPAISIVRRVIFGIPKDDVAVLTVSVSAHPLENVDISAVAVPASARVLRQSLRRLALSIGLNDPQTFDMLVASGEAISNVIEHAYGVKDGMVHVRAFRDGSGLIVEVRDRGAWRPPQNSGRGRGLKLMRSLMQTVDLETSENGTLVRLTMPLSEYAHDRSSNISASRA